MTKIIVKQRKPKSMEFAVKGRRDIDLWDDVDSPEDDEWARLVNEALNPETKKAISKEYYDDSILVAWMLPQDISNQLHGKLIVPDNSEVLPADEYHITLKYIGDITNKMSQMALEQTIRDFANNQQPIKIKLTGRLKRFEKVENGSQDAIYLEVTSDALKRLRDALNGKLEALPGIPKDERLAFTPHITLAYVPTGAEVEAETDYLPLTLTMNSIELRVGDSQKTFPLNGTTKKIVLKV